VIVVCGEPKLEDRNFDTLLNPRLIVEVLSPTTEAYDRGKKFEHYRTIDSLAEYVLVAQDAADAMVVLASIEVEVALAEIYHKVRSTEEGPPFQAWLGASHLSWLVRAAGVVLGHGVQILSP
jgi:Uma2 family endonuclease